ncbi:MAG TPA: CPBP family intramembrane glutamic endopeptidase [Candidatus Acidoferrales bacterium]|nr:CPBP family intramembrane glutamic endopeptidase [Candidatus Acidoferrales bacterium]
MTQSINHGDRAALGETDPVPHLSAAKRWFSLAELAWGSVIVIGHNVYHVIPNEVPILFVIGLISLRLRDGGWSVMGVHGPASWRRTVLYALAAAALRITLGALVIDPLTAHFWPPAVAPSGSEQITGNALVALRWLLLVWTFAAFGEEIGYRGYLLTRAAEAGGRSKAADWVAVLIVSVLFGYGHYYKGRSGIVDSGVAGLILGAAYVLSGRNLWVCILAHGFIDTFWVTAAFFGWFS